MTCWIWLSGWSAGVIFLTRSAISAWRNAPIQGGVADIMLTAYGTLDTAIQGRARLWLVLWHFSLGYPF